MHCYGADGHVRQTQRMKASTGADPYYLDVWQPAHQGNADATEKLDRYTEELKKIHGPDLEDPRSISFNVDAAYATGGGTPHVRLALGDGVVDRGSYVRQHHTSSTSSSSQSRPSRDPETEDKLRRQDELIHNLMQRQQYILSMMQYGYSPYGTPPPFPRPTAPGDPSTPRPDSSQGSQSSQAPVMPWGASLAAGQPSTWPPPPAAGFWPPQGAGFWCLPSPGQSSSTPPTQLGQGYWPSLIPMPKPWAHPPGEQAPPPFGMPPVDDTAANYFLATNAFRLTSRR